MWTLDLAGGGNRIAVIRASGSISRKEGGGLGSTGEGIASDTFIEKIRFVRGMQAITAPHFIVISVQCLYSCICELAQSYCSQ